MKVVIVSLLAILLFAGCSIAWAVEEQAGIEGPRAEPAIHFKEAKPVNLEGRGYVTGWGYTPAQIRTAYGFDALLPAASNTGAGQKIAIIDAYGSPTIDADLAAFTKEYSLTASTLHTHYPSGTPSGTNVGWAEETTLDVEWVSALAPGAEIHLVVAPTSYYSDLFAAVQYAVNNLGAQVISMSWGGTSEITSYDAYLQHANTVFVASTGDSGSGPQYPATSPNVLAVGGTNLYLKPHNSGVRLFPEVAWESSGGGVSAVEPTPAYQKNFGVNKGHRAVPDVSFDGSLATGVSMYYNGGWWITGGTSVGAPCWAAIVAVANQGRKAGNLTDAHQVLYNLAGSQVYYNASTAYRDITQGYNGDYAAGPGYDMVTGLGSPKVNILIPRLRASTATK